MGNREMRRTIGQFLNGLAVAILAGGVVVPLAGGTAAGQTTITALAASVGLHTLALVVARSD